jgi:hypothetical protein
VRFWTLDEAKAYLPRLKELVERVMIASDAAAKAKANGHGPTNDEVREAFDELAEGDIILRDPEIGLIDFHARGADGVVYYLCWRADEDDLAWWHLPEEGFAGRKPLPRDPE